LVCEKSDECEPCGIADGKKGESRDAKPQVRNTAKKEKGGLTNRGGGKKGREGKKKGCAWLKWKPMHLSFYKCCKKKKVGFGCAIKIGRGFKKMGKGGGKKQTAREEKAKKKMGG